MSDEQHDEQHDDQTQEAQGPPLGAFLRRQRELAELTLNQFAGAVGISNAYLSQIERGLRRPSRAVLSSIANGLHLSADVIEAYAQPASKRPRSETLTAIERDPALSPRQRSALAEMYRSFVDLNAHTRARPDETKESGT